MEETATLTKLAVEQDHLDMMHSVMGVIMGTSTLDPLEAVAVLKYGEKVLDAAAKALRKDANAKYAELQAETPDLKRIPVLGDKVHVSRYTPRGTWQFSDELAQLEAEVKSRKETEKATGVATKVERTPDVAKDVLFSVQINKTIEIK